MNVAIIIGSIRKERQSHKIAYYLERELNQRGPDVDLMNLTGERLPIFEERIDHHSEPRGKAEELSVRLQQANALLLVTPEYYGSFSGVIKNALDYFKRELKRKTDWGYINFQRYLWQN